jgi:hypothetical protein
MLNYIATYVSKTEPRNTASKQAYVIAACLKPGIKSDIKLLYEKGTHTGWEFNALIRELIRLIGTTASHYS